MRRVEEMFGAASERDQLLMRRGLHLGRAFTEIKPVLGRGDFLIRNVVGIDRDSGAIAISDMIEVGQTVQFLDWRSGQMRNGRVVAMGDTKVTLHEQGTKTEWKLPYTAVEPPQTTSSAPTQTPPPNAPPAKAGRGDFRCGEKVSFEDKYLQTQVGTVVRINQRTATVDTGEGHSWRVDFALLRQVLDI